MDPNFSLQDFHRIHKLTLMAHGQESARTLGRIAAEPDQKSQQEYEEVFSHLFNVTSPTRGKQANVFYHMLGYVKARLSPAEKGSLLEQISRFQEGGLAHTILLQKFRNHFERYPDPWVSEQTYWLDNGVSPPES